MSSRSTALSCTTQNRIRGNRIGSETSIVTDSDLCGVTTLRHSAAVMVQFGGTMLQHMLQSCQGWSLHPAESSAHIAVHGGEPLPCRVVG